LKISLKSPVRLPHLFFLLLTFSTIALHAEVKPTLVYSPDKAFVVAWFDTDLGEPVGVTRSIILLQLPHGDTPFSLVTFPRDTRAFWSADSKKCLIIDGPDDAGPNTWLFISKNDAPSQPDAIRIYPLEPLSKAFEKRSGKFWRKWRNNIVKVFWQDDETLVLHAWDNDGSYDITIKMSDPNNPIIKQVGAMDLYGNDE